MKSGSILLMTFLVAGAACGEVRLNGIFSDNMVLQRDRPVPVWGAAAPGETVTVTYLDAKVTATAAPDGAWCATLPARAAAKDADLVISGTQTKQPIIFHRVAVGDVWIVAGGDEASFCVSKTRRGADAKATCSKFPQIRYAHLKQLVDTFPGTDTRIIFGGWAKAWVILDRMSAVGYFFAHGLCQKIDVPVGIIDVSGNEQKIAPFIPREGFEAVPELAEDLQAARRFDAATPAGRKIYEDYLARLQKWTDENRARTAAGLPAAEQPITPHRFPGEVTAVFNGTLAPIARFPVRGAVWVTGAGELKSLGDAYALRAKALAAGWRAFLGKDLPILLADKPDEDKSDAGEQLAHEALSTVYHQ